MKIRRPDADKARKQLERQHMAAAEREARVLRPRSSTPVGFGRLTTAQAVADVAPLAEAMDHLVRTTQPTVTPMLQAAMNLPVPEMFRKEMS